MRKKSRLFLFFSIFLLCFIFKSTNAQILENNKPSSIYYKSARGPYWTRNQLDSFLLLKNNSRYKLISRVTGRIQHGDSIIYRINLVLDPEPVDVNNKVLAGQQLPDFELRDLQGNKVSPEDLKGKPVVINFWFTSCVPCIQEMPALNEIKEEFKNTEVVFLAITFDKKAAVQNFLKKHSFNFIAVPDAAVYCSRITGIYPLTLFVNRQGVIKIADHYMPSYDLNNEGYLNFDISGFEKNIAAIK